MTGGRATDGVGLGMLLIHGAEERDIRLLDVCPSHALTDGQPAVGIGLGVVVYLLGTYGHTRDA